MDLRREGDQVALFLELREDDASQPVRRIYWLHPEPQPGGWKGLFPADRVKSWLDGAVPAELPPDMDKRTWRLATRYAIVRRREHPTPMLGVSMPALGDVTWERVT